MHHGRIPVRLSALLTASLLLATATAAAAQETSSALDTLSCRPPGRADSDPRAVRRRAARDTAFMLLEQAAGRAGVERPVGLVYVTGGPDASVRTFGSNLPADAIETIAGRLQELATGSAPRGDGTLLLRLDPLPLPPCDRRPRREREPRLENAGLAQQFLQDLVSRMPAGVRGPNDQHTVLRMVLTREGEVVWIDSARRSGSTAWSAAVLREAHRFRFRVAELDGVPQDVVVVLPVQVRSR